MADDDDDECKSLKPTRTRPGFAQSFGWVFSGSNATLSLSSVVDTAMYLHASAMSRARGLGTASLELTLRPSARLRLASK